MYAHLYLLPYSYSSHFYLSNIDIINQRQYGQGLLGQQNHQQKKR